MAEIARARVVCPPGTGSRSARGLHIEHVFVEGDTVTGIIDWSEASQGDALFDLATLTLGHREHLEDVIAGYGVDVDRNLVRSWWSWRCLVAVRWLFENGYGPRSSTPRLRCCEGSRDHGQPGVPIRVDARPVAADPTVIAIMRPPVFGSRMLVDEYHLLITTRSGPGETTG